MTKPVADGSVAGIVDRSQKPAIIIQWFRYPAAGIRGFIRKSGSEGFGVRLENGKYPTLSLFFKQAYAVALMPIQSGPCDRRLIHFMK